MGETVLPEHVTRFVYALGIDVNLRSEVDVLRVVNQLTRHNTVTVRADRFLTPWRTPEYVIEFVKGFVGVDISDPKSDAEEDFTSV